jgi:hypothetical protein
MNYFASGSPNGSRTNAVGHLKDFAFVVDIGAGKGVFPYVDGKEANVSFTRVEDVARLVAAAFDLSEWKDETGTMSADRVPWAVVAQWGEEITGASFSSFLSLITLAH